MSTTTNTRNGDPALHLNLPKIPIPRAPNPQVDPAGYLRSIHAVRERSALVLDKARDNQLSHFNVDMDRFRDTASFVVSIIKVRRFHPDLANR